MDSSFRQYKVYADIRGGSSNESDSLKFDTQWDNRH